MTVIYSSMFIELLVLDLCVCSILFPGLFAVLV